MGTVPTGRLERDLRKLFIKWVNTLPQNMRKPESHLERFKKQSLNLISKEGGQIARLGVSAGFPAPKELDLNLVADRVYSNMELAVIRAQLMTGLNARESAKALLRAGVQKEYYQLERLARTETVRAYWQNQRNEAADLGLVLVWSVESGPRTCQWCIDRDGMVVDDGAHDHPNGRCTLLPMLPKRVNYRGSVARDGSIYQDPDWDAQFASPVTLSPESVDSSVPYSYIPEESEIMYGLDLAEEERQKLLSTFWDEGGGYSKTTPRDSIEAWERYIAEDYNQINMLYRDPDTFRSIVGGDPEAASMFIQNAKLLEDLIADSPLSQDITVARGVFATPDFDPSSLKVGQTFTDAGFYSTSTGLDIAQDFAKGASDVFDVIEDKGDGWLFISRVPEGTKAIAGQESEAELIFAPGQLQHIIGVDKEKKTVYLEMIS